MSPGAVVAVSAWSAFVALVAYGLICDARRWHQARREWAQAHERADRALARLRAEYEASWEWDAQRQEILALPTCTWADD